MINFAEIAKEAYATAIEKGWYAKNEQDEFMQRDVGEVCALFHSEISEAVEELRKPSWAERKGIYYKDNDGAGPEVPDAPDLWAGSPPAWLKPEGVAVELADLVIRLADSAEAWGVTEAVVAEISQQRCYPDLKAVKSPVSEMAALHKSASDLYKHCSVRMLRWGKVSSIEVSVSVANLIIHIRALCRFFDWDLERAIKVKMAYNKTRPYRHGGKKA